MWSDTQFKELNSQVDDEDCGSERPASTHRLKNKGARPNSPNSPTNTNTQQPTDLSS